MENLKPVTFENQLSLTVDKTVGESVGLGTPPQANPHVPLGVSLAPTADPPVQALLLDPSSQAAVICPPPS